MSTKSEIENLLKELTPKQILFFQEWLKTGNGVKAAQVAYPDATYSSAGVLAHENLKLIKNPIKTFLEHNGISIGYLTKILVEATQAERRDQFSGEMYKDHRTRIDAVDRLARWLGIDAETNKTEINIGDNRSITFVIETSKDENNNF